MGFLEMFKGYVDDALAIVHTRYGSVSTFLEELSDIDPEQLVWEAKVNAEVANFLDLTISKSLDFDRTGKLHFQTYRKQNWRPQYIVYSSQHAPACFRGIFKGEAIRHMVNCSTCIEYDKRIAELRQTLRIRGYPECVMPRIPYDAPKRQEYLDKYRRRGTASSPSDSKPFLKLSVGYSASLRKLRLRGRAENLISRLRARLGGDFLQEARIVVAHPIQDCLFRSSYQKNFLLDTVR